MVLPHVQPLERLAAEEIGSLIARLEALDAGLERGGHRAAKLLEHKARLGRELRTWLREFGGTPRARGDFVARMASGSLGEEIARRLHANGAAR